jgi:hypothetical protein
MLTNRCYAFDDIKVVGTGLIVPRAGNDLRFEITYTTTETFQFLGFVGGQLEYSYTGLHSSSFPVVAGPGFLNPGPSCLLDVDFNDPTFLGVIQDPLNGAVTLKFTMILRVNQMDLPLPGYPNGLPPGFYDLTMLAGQFKSGTTDSCDIWHNNVLVLNPRTTTRFEILAPDFEDAHLGWPFRFGVCETAFLLETDVAAALPGVNEFPGNEFRPWVEWGGAGTQPVPNALPAPSMTLPAGVQFGSAFFTVFDRYGSPGFNSPMGFPVRTFGGGGPTITFLDYDDDPGVAIAQTPWPLFALDGFPIAMAIRGSLLPECPPTAANQIPDQFPVHRPPLFNIGPSGPPASAHPRLAVPPDHCD